MIFALEFLEFEFFRTFTLLILPIQKVREIQIEVPQMSKKLYFLCFRSQRDAFSRNSRTQLLLYTLAFKLIYDQIDNG